MFNRFLQIIVSLLFLIFSLPIFLLAILAIWLESGRPIFYVHKRIGKDNRIFWLYKLRTMEVDSEKHTGASLINSIDKITKVGKVLRILKIDEIPQLINVLKGDMNLVGPRPERPIISNKLIHIIPDYHLRLKVKPGLTGPAQLFTPFDTPKIQRLKYDLEYIECKSLGYDTKLIGVTICYIIKRAIKLIQEKTGKNTSMNSFQNKHIIKKNKKILIFQNDLLDLITLKKILREEDYIFLTADKLEDIYYKAKAETLDLIICDLFLDKKEHLILCNLLKSDKYTMNIPIIILTNSKRKEDFLTARELFIYNYIIKPVDPDILKNLIEEALINAEISDNQKQYQTDYSSLIP